MDYFMFTDNLDIVLSITITLIIIINIKTLKNYGNNKSDSERN